MSGPEDADTAETAGAGHAGDGSESGPDGREEEKARRIVHVDLDAFYASVEQRDFPEKYAGEPIAVGGDPPKGVVKAASYEARPHGVHSAQPAVEADRMCPDLIFVPPRMDVYQEESGRIRDILREYTDLIEPISLDEAYLDVTDREPSQSRFGDCSFERTRVDETARWPCGTKLHGTGCGVRNPSQERGDGSSART